MWQLLSRPLEWLGRLRIGFSLRRSLRVGDPNLPDAQGGMGWRDYVTAEALFDIWGPVEGSPWVPYHAVPLFAAIDRIKREDLGPGDVVPPSVPAVAEVPALSGGDLAPGAPGIADAPVVPPATVPDSFPHARPGAAAPHWLNAQTMVIVDLPDPAVVEVGTWLVMAGCQPVCTFDNWPHARGLLKAERLLAALLRWATTVAAARSRLVAHSPPVWLCDSARLGQRAGTPGEFDNRYYLDDSILPGPSVVAAAGIARVVYVTAGAPAVPTIDLDEFFAELRKAHIALWHVDLANGLDPVELVLPTVPRPAPSAGFRRSAAGGFGTEVPQPSSSSSG